MYNPCVLPAIPYGAYTLTPTKQALNNLVAAKTKMGRNVLDVTYKDRRPTSESERGKYHRHNQQCEKNENVFEDRQTDRQTDRHIYSTKCTSKQVVQVNNCAR